MILDLGQLVAARTVVGGTTIQEVLDEKCAPAVLDAVDAMVRACAEDGRSYFGYVLGPRIAARFPYRGDAWTAIRRYCGRRLLIWDLVAWTQLLEVLLAIFQPENVGAWIGGDVLRQLEPRLTFDDDGLLVGDDRLEFTPQGVMTQDKLLLYHPDVPGKIASGAFVEDLIVSAQEANTRRFGLRLQENAVLAREYAAWIVTRAYIRGPRGLSEATLDDPRFPEDKTGTVTEHRRVSDDPVLALFPLDLFEVMWSERRDDAKNEHVKVVQMEELVPVSKRRDLTTNRYLHSEWDCNVRRFTHLDGAVRGYTGEQYEARRKTDIKKAGKGARLYRKVFRIDAELDARTWSRLVGKFFDPNELAIEYLGGPDPSEAA